MTVGLALAITWLLIVPALVGVYLYGISAGARKSAAHTRWHSVCKRCGWDSGAYASQSVAGKP